MDQGIEARIRRLESIEEIRQLVYRYALAVDSRDLDALADLFVEDVKAAPGLVGRGELRRSFDAMLRGIGVSVLNVGNHVIDLQGDDRGSGVVYCRAELEIGEQWVVQAIQYRDRYERRADRWYFAARRHMLWYGADLLQRPIGLPPADWPRSPTGKGELPEEWPSWRRFWERGT